MAKVLAAIDLTPLGRRVAERARLVADQLEAELALLHVVEPLAEAFVPESVSGLVRRHCEESARETAEWIRGRSEGTVRLSTVKGSPSWEVVKAAKTADLAVVGSSSLDHSAVGPVSRRVAEASRSDVLVVRRQPRAPYRRVVVGVDFSEGSLRAVHSARRLVPDGEITLVYSLPARFDPLLGEAGLFPEEVDHARRTRLEEAGMAMEAFAEHWPGQVRTVVTHGPPVDVIEETARRRSADLVVVGSRGAGATRMVLLGSVAGDVLASVPCDVLVARVPSDFRRP